MTAATNDNEESRNNIHMYVILLIKEHMDIFYHSAKLPKVQKASTFLSNRTLFNSVLQIPFYLFSDWQFWFYENFLFF